MKRYSASMSDENERAIIAPAKTVGILLPVVLRGCFDYAVPEGMQLNLGDYVRVPFGRRSAWGVVWGAAQGVVDAAKIKAVESVAAHLPPMSAEMRGFIDWVAWYTLAPQGMVLKMALSSEEALEAPEEEARYLLGEVAGRQTPSRLRIVSYMNDGTPRSAKAKAPL